jgi:zinc protease
MYTHLASIPLIGSLHIQHYRLSNGLHVAIVEDPTTPIFSYQTWFKVGSTDERPGKQGLAHLFEHMMFRKTKNLDMGEWERKVSTNGGAGINAYTSRDQTVYYFNFPNDKLDIAAGLEIDRMNNLVIEPEMFETEKGAVLTERNRNLDNPGRYLWEELYKIVYTSHNYRYSIIGEEESIKGFSVDDAVLFYQTYYSPQNALIIIVGDVKAEETIADIAHHYGSTVAGIKVAERPFIDEKFHTESITIHKTHHRATQRMIAKAWLTRNILDADYAPLAIAGSLLSGQKTSLLQKRLVNTAKAQNVHADIYIGKDNGTFEFYAELAHGEGFEPIEAILTDSIQNIADGKITSEQIQIVKNSIEKEFYSNLTSPSALARFLGEGFIFANDLSFQVKLMDRLKQVDVRDIQQAVQKYLIDHPSSTIYLSPEK